MSCTGSIPPGTRPGGPFDVLLPSGERIQITCPQDRKPGDRFLVNPFHITIPQGVKPGQTFKVQLPESKILPFPCPSDKRSGDTVLIYTAEFPRVHRAVVVNSSENEFNRVRSINDVSVSNSSSSTRSSTSSTSAPQNEEELLEQALKASMKSLNDDKERLRDLEEEEELRLRLALAMSQSQAPVDAILPSSRVSATIIRSEPNTGTIPTAPSRAVQPKPPRPPRTRDRARDLFDEDDVCVVCLDRQVCVFLVPCNHFIMCSQCANQWTESCPKCRTPISDRLSIS
eukprot:c6856_g1_i1.p1 GENE.c6856_g1_i1~~c6856_g1_i1.p1  ORF type:complete len:286 (-),score=47.09 c6856_g1_i1:82-939(-)